MKHLLIDIVVHGVGSAAFAVALAEKMWTMAFYDLGRLDFVADS